MTLHDQKNPERLTRQNTMEGQDDEYDLYLFWPSMSGRDVSSDSGDTPSSPLYGPVSLHSESTEYDYSGFSSGPPSPITFAPPVDCLSRFPMEPDFGTSVSDPPKAEAKAEPPKEPETAKYSALFKLGLYLSQMTHLVNRAIEGVKIKTRKPRSQAP